MALVRLARYHHLTLAAVACTAFGVAAFSGFATLVWNALLAPPPFPDGERLVRVWSWDAEGGGREGLSYPWAAELERRLETLDALEPVAPARLVIATPEGSRRIEGEAVRPGYFRLLGVRPHLGRLFAEDDGAVALLSHQAWGARFAFDPGILGRTLSSDRGPLSVVGVLPPDFFGTVEDDSGELELWLPLDGYLTPEERGDSARLRLWVLGRLAPGVELAAAAAETEAFAQNAGDRRQTLRLEPFGANWREGLRQGGLLLVVAATMLLATAGLDVGVLLLARGLERRREVAIRLALGATPRRVLALALSEPLAVVATGGALGAALGLLAVPKLALLFPGVPAYVSTRPDPRFLLLAFVVLALVAAAAGAAPALLALRTQARDALSGGRGVVGDAGWGRAWRIAVLSQLALSACLAIGAGLLVRSFHNLAGHPLGFRSRDMLRLALFLDDRDVPDDAGLPAAFAEIRRASMGVAGVEEVSLLWPTVPIRSPARLPLHASGVAATEREEGLRVGVFAVDHAFFEILEIPLLAGRAFESTEAARPVAVVGESVARLLGGTDRAVGRGVRVGDHAVQVVGVVADAMFGGAREDADHRYEVYVPLELEPRRVVSLAVRSHGDPQVVLGHLARSLGALAPYSAVDWSDSYSAQLAEWNGDARTLTGLAAGFAAASTLLAGAALAGLLAGGVTRRRREYALRLALGASPLGLGGGILAAGAGLTSAGLALGWLLAIPLRRLLERELFGIAGGELASGLTASAALLVVAVLVSLPPALRAARTHPMTALRDE
ncbi:MAG TPA: ABC transporter permease [Thermoanaerobaculia bacterium]|nr:ABC transporter permease [Thermoanaerobaculia bacterium]